VIIKICARLLWTLTAPVNASLIECYMFLLTWCIL